MGQINSKVEEHPKYLFDEERVRQIMARIGSVVNGGEIGPPFGCMRQGPGPSTCKEFPNYTSRLFARSPQLDFTGKLDQTTMESRGVHQGFPTAHLFIWQTKSQL